MEYCPFVFPSYANPPVGTQMQRFFFTVHLEAETLGIFYRDNAFALFSHHSGLRNNQQGPYVLDTIMEIDPQSHVSQA